ncbi:hypothetical protein ACSHWB_27625 [Lentzea sp. HUAS TT2]|uniref:hypothetical protein n=1 Tax=Lentzea sp. HUAS TT2 TaxID=3447454 RepID=UPI003F6F6C4D
MTVSPRIDTPLGPVTFVVRADGAEVELGITKTEAVIPSEYPPVELWTAAWRFTAREAVTGLEVTVGLTATAPGVDGGPDSGERLHAVTLENADAVVSVGGPDEERLSAEFGLEWTVHFLDDRTLTWSLPALEPSGTARLTLAVAWSGPTDLPATWWAVDLP